jgi:hypothetical protein
MTRFRIILALVIVGLCGGAGFAQSAGGVFNDPRGKYRLSYTSDWKVMMNFAGMPSFFCNWEGCEKSALTGCTFQSFQVDLPVSDNVEEYDKLLMMVSFELLKLNPDLPFGAGGEPTSGNRVEQIGAHRWASFDFDASALGKKTKGSWWLTLGKTNLVQMRCEATPEKWPDFESRVRRVLETVKIAG